MLVQMKKIFFLFFVVSLLLLQNCKKENQNPWKIEIKNPAQNVEVTDISKEFYDTNVPLEEFKQKYPWFQGSVPDEDYSIRRADTAEVRIYKEAISKIDIAKLNKDLTGLFSHIKYHFPEFKEPQVFLFSSVLSGIMEPVFYRDDVNMLFIDITGFMGDNNPNYKGLEQYFQLSMNPQNIVPKVSQTFAEYFVQPNPNHQKFIDEIIYQGKIMTLQDAFLPDFPDYLKMHYSQKQFEWATENEINIWNYFVESNLIFSDDIRLKERFINPGPFSKFYTEIDNESSPRVGIFTGWQITRKFYQEKPETKLGDFLKMSAQDIFNQSNYKPKY